MHEPTPDSRPFGLIAEFERADHLVEAIKRTREAGFRSFDAYSPFPLPALIEAMDISDRRVPWLTFAGAVVGAVSGFGLQVYTNLDYPIIIGGRPLLAVPAFMLITFELAVLFAVLAGVLGMLVLNHLPRLHHPLFDVENFGLASSSRFFLVVFSNDRAFDARTTRDFLQRLKPLRVDTVGSGEEPE